LDVTISLITTGPTHHAQVLKTVQKTRTNVIILIWTRLHPSCPRSLSENSVVGPRASVFSPDKDGEAGDVCFIVDTAGCSPAENKPLKARSSSPTGP
jgi:hypothetical protein